MNKEELLSDIKVYQTKTDQDIIQKFDKYFPGIEMSDLDKCRYWNFIKHLIKYNGLHRDLTPTISLRVFMELPQNCKHVMILPASLVFFDRESKQLIDENFDLNNLKEDSIISFALTASDYLIKPIEWPIDGYSSLDESSEFIEKLSNQIIDLYKKYAKIYDYIFPYQIVSNIMPIHKNADGKEIETYGAMTRFGSIKFGVNK